MVCYERRDPADDSPDPFFHIDELSLPSLRQARFVTKK